MKSLRFLLLALLVVSSLFLLCSCESDPDDPDGDTSSSTFSVMFDYDYNPNAGQYEFTATAYATNWNPTTVVLTIDDTVMTQKSHPTSTSWIYESMAFTPGQSYKLALIVDGATSSVNTIIANPATITGIVPNPVVFDEDATLSWTLVNEPFDQQILIGKYYTAGMVDHDPQTITIPEPDEGDPAPRSVVIPALTILPDLMGSVNVYHDSYWLARSTDEKVSFVYLSTSNPKMIQANGTMAAPPKDTPLPNVDRSEMIAKIMKRLTR